MLTRIDAASAELGVIGLDGARHTGTLMLRAGGQEHTNRLSTRSLALPVLTATSALAPRADIWLHTISVATGHFQTHSTQQML